MIVYCLTCNKKLNKNAYYTKSKRCSSCAKKGSLNHQWKDGQRSFGSRKDYLRNLRHKKNISKKYIGKYGGQYKWASPLLPWQKTFRRILARCFYDKKNSYYKRGIKVRITMNELKLLWFRDKAYLMTKPSIHRIDSKKNYSYGNCMYVELKKHLKMKG